MTTEMDDAPSSFWVRAMYDYESTDDSSLTFSRGDIVEVLTQLESGWWDGLIDTERGWFPSNFVTIISDEEAEAELALRRAANAPAAVVEVDPAQLDASGSDSEWLQDELEQAAGIDIALPGIDLNFPPVEPVRRAADSAQLWLPEVQPNGQIVYVNGTGERRAELPAGIDVDDITTPDPVPRSLSPSPRPTPPPPRQRANTATTTSASSLGGFAFVRRSDTPEPWHKRLTDDGHAFYYENRETGEIVWTRPDPASASTRGPSAQQSLASSASGYDLRARYRNTAPYDGDTDIDDESDGRDSDPVLDRTLPATNRLSVYSDVSEVNPLGRDSPLVRSAPISDVRPLDAEPRTDPAEVQRRLAPAPPETIEELSVVAKQAIGAVSRSMEQQPVPHVGLVAQVIVAVRNLLYVSGTLAAAPSALYPLVPGDGPVPGAPAGASADLKQFQRKVTATLSKLVLSARAADSTSDAGEEDSGARSRVAIDAGELERAVVRFVVEVRRASEQGAERRLRGELTTMNVGRGMPGGGMGGRWQGNGFISGSSVGKNLSTEVYEELRMMMGEVERGLAEVETGVSQVGQGEDRGGETGVSMIITRGRAAIAALCTLLNAAEDVDLASKVGPDVEVKRDMARKGAPEEVRKVGNENQLRRAGSRDELRRMGSRDQLRRVGSREALSRMGSRDALSRPGSKDGLRRTGAVRSPAISPAALAINSATTPGTSNVSLNMDNLADVRRAVRRLEIVKQSLYDAGVTLLLASQTVHVAVLKSAGSAPAPIPGMGDGVKKPVTINGGVKRAEGGDVSAVSLVAASIASIRRNGREMLELFGALVRAGPPESYVPASTLRARAEADMRSRGADPRSRIDNHSRAEYHSTRTDAYSQTTEHYSHKPNADSYSDVLPRDDSDMMMSPVDDQLALMYGQDTIYGEDIYFGNGADEQWKEKAGADTGRQRLDSLGRDRLDSVGRDRLDSAGSGRGTYGRAYPERGMYDGGEREREVRREERERAYTLESSYGERVYANGERERPYGSGGERDKPRAPLRHLDSAVSLPQSDISAESGGGQRSRAGTALGRPVDDLDLRDEDGPVPRSPPRPRNKIARLLGDEVAAEIIRGGGQVPIAPIVDTTPWYLKPIYNDPTQILTNTDGGVRGGTLPALVERLTMHDQLDAPFIESFLMTYKSFTTMEELFRLLVERYKIAPPDELTPAELPDWTNKKQRPVRVRVVNIYRKMLLDTVIDKEDYYILNHIKTFAEEIAIETPAAKQLIVLVDRLQNSGESLARKFTPATPHSAPPSILPKAGKRVKLLDCDTLELARQLTIIESRQYNAIKPIECLARARDEPAENDSIKTIITTTNKIASWVAFSVLEKEDPRRRMNVIKHFIQVAEKCRGMHNYSSMAALIAGLNSPPIRRLKRTWDTVPQRWTAMLDDVESTLDSGKNFTMYKQRLKQVDAPCVPFLGVYLTVLTFIQDGNKDFISKENGIINFGKRQKTAEVIREIQGYQSRRYNLAPVDQVQAFIEQSLASVEEKADYWEKSLEIEPREREDEKMTRMLQESGFL